VRVAWVAWRSRQKGTLLPSTEEVEGESLGGLGCGQRDRDDTGFLVSTTRLKMGATEENQVWVVVVVGGGLQFRFEQLEFEGPFKN
jgi:hypothetical protein